MTARGKWDRPAAMKRLMDNSEPDANGCRLWTGLLDQHGYGRLRSGSLRSAHRIAWREHNGPIPPGLWVLHTCDNRRCINPEHLYLGTVGDNVRDMEERGRRVTVLGSQKVDAKMTEAMVSDLRARDFSEWGSLSKAAREMGLDVQTVRRAIRGDTWKHVPCPSPYGGRAARKRRAA